MANHSPDIEKSDLPANASPPDEDLEPAPSSTPIIIINASGHPQLLRRNFSLLSLAGIGLVVGNVWPAIGGSILVSIFNGGPPGVLYEFIVVSVFYWTVAASIAELASAIPSSAGVYHWASVTPGTNSRATGLLSLVMICIGLTVVGLMVDCGRTLWSLSRDNATPFPRVLGKVNPKLDVPVMSTVASAVLVSVLGCIYVGNTTAFNAFVGTFILLSTSGFLAAILPNLLTGRKNIQYGPFHMKGWKGFVVNGIACGYMMVWFVIYCFPYYLPTDAASMNYASLIWGGLTLLVALWWFLGVGKDYEGPRTTGGIVSEAEGFGGRPVNSDTDREGMNV